jgi:preprotein translocase subunit SecG
MLILVTIIHVLVCIFLIIVVLLQSGKAADLAGAFGGMGSQTAFGPRGSATLLSKATTISAVVFMITSLSLSVLATRNAGVGRTVLDNQKSKPTVPAGTVPSAAQPSVTLTPEGGGPSRTVPLKLPPAPGAPGAPAAGTQTPPPAAPAQKK